MESVRAQQANVDIALKADQDGTITSPIQWRHYPTSG